MVSVYGDPCVEGHTIYIYDRGGRKRVSQLVDVSQVRWGRERDTVSEADVLIQGAACAAQARILAAIEPKRSELVIFRGLERVWEGPVNRVGWHADYVEINARDVMDYLYGRPLSKTWDNSYPHNDETMSRLEEIVIHELTHQYVYSDDVGRPVVVPAWEAQDPPVNIRQYFTVHHSANEVRTSAKTTPFQMTVGEHIDNFARTGGIDYTVLGRAIHLWDTSRSLGELRIMTEADFYGEIIVTAYGADHASVAFAVADDGRYGGAGGTPSKWRWFEMSGPAGETIKLPGDRDRRPSLVERLEGWEGYRYWMAYEPLTSKDRIRVMASKNLRTWKDVAETNVDAEEGTHVTAGNWPALAFGWTNAHLWLFFIGTNGHLYRTRSTDGGKKWSVKVDTYTPPAGVTLTSPSLYYSPASKQWVFWGVNSVTQRIVWMTSTDRLLDGTGSDWGTLHQAVVSENPDIATIEMRRIGNRWVGLMTSVGGIVRMIESKQSTGDSNFNLAPHPAVPGSANGKATWLFRPNTGNMSVLYGTAGGIINYTAMTGPSPEFVPGDENIAYYGPWSKVFTVYDEDDTHPPSQADLNGQARRNLQGRAPVPVEVRVPDNSSIRLSTGITIALLVPGTLIPLRATLNSRQMTQVQKLDKLVVTETSDGETVQVTLIPITKPDSDVVEPE